MAVCPGAHLVGADRDTVATRRRIGVARSSGGPTAQHGHMQETHNTDTHTHTRITTDPPTR